MTPQERYKAKNIQQFKLELNKKTEADIIDHLNKQPNKQGYVKHLIREDIKKESDTEN